MATGIQTGIRRGSRVSVGASSQPQPSRLQQCQSRWKELSTATKWTVLVGAIFLQLALVGVGLHSNQNSFVDLYPTKLQPQEVPEISRALLEMQIEHEIAPTNDGLLVSKPDRSRARAILASRNLPLHRVLTPSEVTSDMIRSTSERKAMEQRLLEGEITMALREVDGVRDARVKLAIPEKSYLAGDSDPTRASVTLMLEPAHKLDRPGISGLVHLVAFSVPGLTPENVRLVDSRGLDLSTLISPGPQSETSSAHFDVRAAEEKRLQDKVQQALDIKLPGRTKVLVNLDLDFSTAERRLYTPGSEKDDGLVRSSFQLVTEMLDTEKGKTEQKDFQNRKESVNYEFTKNYFASLVKHARTERISATVFADNVSPKEAESLAASVKGALGLQEGRGDFVYVDVGPWQHDLTPPMTAPDPVSDSPWALDAADRAPLSTTGLLALLMAQTALLVGGFGGYLYLSSRNRSAAGIESNALVGMRPTGIVDHGRSKIGETTLDFNRTGVQTTEMLEGIVRERPTQVADLLRSTWLS